jgi:hypothetical protein
MLQYRTGCSLYRFFTVFAGEELCVKRASPGAPGNPPEKAGGLIFPLRHNVTASPRSGISAIRHGSAT